MLLACLVSGTREHPLFLLKRHGSPAQLRKAGKRRLISLLRSKAPRIAERLVTDIFDALDEQSIVVAGTDAAALIVPSLTASLSAVLDQRQLLAALIEKLLQVHPLMQCVRASAPHLLRRVWNAWSASSVPCHRHRAAGLGARLGEAEGVYGA